VPELVYPYLRRADGTALSLRHTRLLEIDWRLISRQPRKFLLGIPVRDIRNGRGGCQIKVNGKRIAIDYKKNR